MSIDRSGNGEGVPVAVTKIVGTERVAIRELLTERLVGDRGEERLWLTAELIRTAHG